MSKTSHDYYLEIMEIMDKLSDKEVVDSFNSQCCIRAYGFARAGHLNAIHKQLENRRIDFSEIGDCTGIAFKYKAVLIDKKMLSFKFQEN